MNPNRMAFLSAIAWAEIGTYLLNISDNGYNVLVGSTSQHPLYFNSYRDHPRIYNRALNSTASGRYQILEHNYDFYKKALQLWDFSPTSQDKIASRMIYECHVLEDVDAGINIENSFQKCASRWASLPGAKYGQPTKKLDDVVTAYLDNGGICV